MPRRPARPGHARATRAKKPVRPASPAPARPGAGKAAARPRPGASTARRTPASGRTRRPPNATPERAKAILDALEQAHPEATCALHYRNAFELAVATILSAQCTDERVNQVTPALFARFPDAASLAVVAPESVEPLIRPTGFFRAKARSLVGFARGLAERHGGEVPRSLADLVELPGIGRKTASVVLGHAYEVAEGIAIDTHVLRVARRLGLTGAEDPLRIEAELMRIVPRERWTRTTDLLIFHGRKVCDARRPACGACTLFPVCAWDARQAFATGQTPRRKPERAADAANAKSVGSAARGARSARPAPRPLQRAGRGAHRRSRP